MCTTVTHFGVKVIKKKYSLSMCRAEFAQINRKSSFGVFFECLDERGAYCDKQALIYDEKWCEEYREICLRYYDSSMTYFESLDKIEFDKAIKAFLRKHRGFKELHDLHRVENKSGYYMMIMDQYKQAYIGRSIDIAARIRQHWNKVKPLDRTMLPVYNEKSVFSVDFFRALDTTRIYVWPRKYVLGIESELIADFPSKFSCNRIGGDTNTLAEALLTVRTEY